MTGSRTSGRAPSNWPLVVMLLAPVAFLALMRFVPALDLEHQSMQFHLVIVSSIAACALAVAIGAGIAATRSHHPGIVLLAAGGLGVAFPMLAHGLLTPGVHGMMYSQWVGRAPIIAIVLFVVCQALASIAPRVSWLDPIARHPAVFLGAWGALLAAGCALIVAEPMTLHGGAPFAREELLARAVSAVASVVLIAVAWQHWQRYRLGGSAMQLALTSAAAMSVAAISAIHFGALWHISWWDYHVYLLVGFGYTAYAVFGHFRSSRALHRALEHAFVADPMEHIAHSYPEALRVLVHAVEVKDSYTHGHSRRTAEIATALGVELSLPPGELRVLAQGAYLHDVGKITIPDEILNKPGKLTDEERAVIETHAAAGAEIVARADSLQPCAGIVRHHHERFDGAGYPDHLADAHIPFLARITAVADVWDALTSDRAYRPGWEPEAALAHIVAGAGTHFDPVVVAALVDLAEQWGYRVADTITPELVAAEVAAHADSCHDVGDSRVPVLVVR